MDDLTGQLKMDMFTGKVSKVASKATEGPPQEQQASLELWAKEQEALDKLHLGQYIASRA